MIKPSIGRVVWYHPIHEHEQPLAAVVSFVHSNTSVNLAAFHPNGHSFGIENVQLFQGEGSKPENSDYCEWMPYQKGQAAKTEELEKELAAKPDAAPMPFGPGNPPVNA